MLVNFLDRITSLKAFITKWKLFSELRKQMHDKSSADKVLEEILAECNDTTNNLIASCLKDRIMSIPCYISLNK
jgi:predicted component of type VI protein secretion system